VKVEVARERAYRWLTAGLSLSRSHHCVQSLFLCLYTGVTTLHRGTIPIATGLHSATDIGPSLSCEYPFLRVYFDVLWYLLSIHHMEYISRGFNEFFRTLNNRVKGMPISESIHLIVCKFYCLRVSWFLVLNFKNSMT